MTHCYGQSKLVAELTLQLLFPQPGAISVAAATVRQYQQLRRVRIVFAPMLGPPLGDGVSSWPRLAGADPQRIEIASANGLHRSAQVEWEYSLPDVGGAYP